MGLDEVGSDKTLLVAGIATPLIGLAGMAVSIEVDGDWREFFDSWTGTPHGRMMSWWDGSDHDEPSPPVLEGAEDYRIEAGDLYFGLL